MIDSNLAHSQYELLKKSFLKQSPFWGIREFTQKCGPLVMDPDSGPVLFQLSPTGTAFAIGPATFFDDTEVRLSFLRTGELAGFTAGEKRRHYLLANLALVGETIVLAMRTSIPEKSCKVNRQYGSVQRCFDIHDLPSIGGHATWMSILERLCNSSACMTFHKDYVCMTFHAKRQISPPTTVQLSSYRPSATLALRTSAQSAKDGKTLLSGTSPGTSLVFLSMDIGC